VGIGGTFGMVSDDSEIFRLDNMESEVVGGACGASDRDDVSKKVICIGLPCWTV